MTLRCPACGGDLARMGSEYELLSCPACGGVFADSAASARIVATVDRELVRLAKDAAMRAAERDAGAPPRRAGGARACPIGGEPMATVRSASVTVDVCRAHGTWFDRDELGRLARNIQYERLSSPDTSTSDSAEVLLLILGHG